MNYLPESPLNAGYLQGEKPSKLIERLRLKTPEDKVNEMKNKLWVQVINSGFHSGVYYVKDKQLEKLKERFGEENVYIKRYPNL